jgi:hypothetical protein
MSSGNPKEIQEREKPTTARALLKALRESGLIGMWKNRTDIKDSVKFARRLRRDAEKRGGK